MIKIKLFLFLIILFLQNNIFQNSLGREYTMDDLFNIAQKNSQNIAASQYFADAQSEFAKQQKYWDNIELGYDNNGVSLSQKIPFKNKLNNKYNIENSSYQILQLQKDNLELFVKSVIFSLAYNYYGTMQKINLLQQRLDRLNSVNNYLLHITIVSPTKKAQVEIVKDKISLLEVDLINLKNELYQIWNKMNVFLDINDNTDINLSLLWINNNNAFDDNKLQNIINTSIENNLELKQQKQLIEKYNQELKFAKIEQMPDIKISATETNDGFAKGGVSISVPVVNRNQKKISSQEAKLKAQTLMYNFEKHKLTQELKNDIKQYNTLIQIAKIFPLERINIAISKLNTQNIHFQKGILDFITYIELDSQEYDIIWTAIETQINLAFFYSQIMIKQGKFEIPRYY